jgi:hypothetical protein
MPDIMRIEILADGTIKTTTDPISGPNHQSAEAFMKDLSTLAGGPVTKKARHEHHTHTHTHAEHTH